MRVGHHRRFTANHTFHLDWGDQRLFVKISPSRREATEEVAGHAQLRGYYPVPTLVAKRHMGRYSMLVYRRHGDGAPDSGLLLDDINAADQTGDRAELDATLTRVIDYYRTVMTPTLHRARLRETVNKLYGQRVRPGGRLDVYYDDDRPLLILSGEPVRPSDLARMTLVVNGRTYRLDLPALIGWLRQSFAPGQRVWAAVSQGDPTDVNIGAQPVWFDYDTGGLNALAGEFACFLWYQRLHGGWLVPTYNPAAFVDHPATFAGRERNRPAVQVQRLGRETIEVAYQHQASPARQQVMARYLKELVYPFASTLGVADLLGWLRPYFALRILGVYSLPRLTVPDAALSLAYLAETLDTRSRLEDLLGLPVP